MIQSLFSGVSGMLANQTQMDVIGGDIANANTTAYKSSTANFTESFIQVSRAATTNEPVGLGVGLGASVNSTTTHFTQGVFQTTNVPSDIGINGPGFFCVQTVGGANYVTRNGAFVEDSGGYLRTTDGNFLLGVENTAAVPAAPTSPSSGYPPDKIFIPTTVTSGSPVVSYAIDTTGAVTLTGQDGTTQLIAYITLQKYDNNNGLTDVGGSLYEYQSAAGPNQFFQAGSAGAGTLQSGVLESSNVDLSTEFANMIISQRGFEASARVITVSDEMLNTVVHLKQG